MSLTNQATGTGGAAAGGVAGAVAYLAARGLVEGRDYVAGSALATAYDVALREEARQRIPASGFITFWGYESCVGCLGWNGRGERCHCGAQRVGWAAEFGHSHERPAVFAASKEVGARPAFRVLTEPLSEDEIVARRDEHNFVTGIVAVDLGVLIARDFEGLLDHLSELLVGSELLMEIGYKVLAFEPRTGRLLVEVTGDASAVLPDEEEDGEAAEAAAA